MVPRGTVGRIAHDVTLMTASRVRQTDNAHDEVFCKRCQAENMAQETGLDGSSRRSRPDQGCVMQ